ncbi:MAG TPA: hypothetical protein VI382_01950, partial [Candidatus Manganitrophaceae bacterium]|nr:hypothetical protein [Candidatus Manganitrophaceae bacterium]
MTAPTVKDLLLAPELSLRQVTELLKPYGFQDIKKADTNLQMIADEPSVRTRFAGVLDEFLSCLAESADPDQALNHFERFSRAAFSKTALFSYLQESPRTISLLAKV